MDNFFSEQSMRPHPEFFKGSTHPWELVPKIEAYLAHLFEEKKITGNIAHNVFVDPTATVDPTARIIGPAYIGKNTKIGFNSLLRENVVVLDGCVIGHAVELKNVFIMNSTAVPHFNYVGDSVVGSKVNFGAGSIVANWRFDEKSIPVIFEGKRIDSGLVKFGAIIGDGSKVGVNAMLNPGTLLEKNCLVFPLTHASGHHKANSKVS